MNCEYPLLVYLVDVLMMFNRQIIDGEVREMVEEAYRRSIALMEEKKEQVRLVAELLLKQETISHTDVANLIGARYYSELIFLNCR